MESPSHLGCNFPTGHCSLFEPSMLIRSTCMTTTPRNCREDFTSPMWLTISQLPFPRPAQRTSINQRVLAGRDESRPDELFFFVDGDPIYLPPGFQPFGDSAILSGVIHHNRQVSSVIRIYLGTPLLRSILQSNIIIRRRRRYNILFRKARDFTFLEVNLKLQELLTPDQTPETEFAPCVDAPIPLSNQLSLFSDSDLPAV